VAFQAALQLDETVARIEHQQGGATRCGKTHYQISQLLDRRVVGVLSSGRTRRTSRGVALGGELGDQSTSSRC
jgi:hypothetical protein